MALCEHYGIPIQEVILGGEDTTMWCRSIASGGITLETELPDDIWLWYTPPYHAPDVATTLSLTFEAGVPTAINGQRMSLAELVPILNDVGGANGLGRIDIIEDGIMDLKSREIYEAPAAAIILALHRDLEQLTLTRDEIQFKKSVDARWSSLVFSAEWFTPLKTDLDAFIAQSQGPVNGTYEIELYKGTMTILSRQSPSSLYFEEVRSIQSSSFDQRWCGPAAQVRALPFELLAKRDARWKAARGGTSPKGDD
jgi:argininosuccinate synthase